MTIPRLSIRTQFSFRRCYGPTDRVIERLVDLGITQAGIVDDDGTWGHTEWAKLCAKANISPIFGTRLTFPTEDDRKPSSPIIATDLRKFYRFSSTFSGSPESLATREGIIAFSGAALTNPDHFDYVDLDHSSLIAARRAIKLSEKTGAPLVLMPHNDYPFPEDRNKFLAWDDSKRMTTQHIMDNDELRRAYHFLDDAQWATVLENTHQLAERCAGLELPKMPLIHVEGDLNKEIEEGIKYRLEQGHIKEWTHEYQARLEREMVEISRKNFESYFLAVGDMVRWSKDNGVIVGPGRGSSSGSLTCYVLRITEVDPLVHNLLFERFIDISRSDLPDIDIDFDDKQRHRVFEYMAEKYGEGHTARLGNISRLKARSAIAHVGKKLGVPSAATFAVTNVLIEHSSGDARYGKGLEDTLVMTAPGRKFAADYPEARELMPELEHHVSHTSVHAAGLLVSHEPVIEFCTVRDGIAQIDKKGAEEIGGLKIDCLGLTTLGIINDADCISIEELYRITLDDPNVFAIINDKKFAGVFQFEGAAQRRVSMTVPIDSFERINHIGALARPGPMVGGATTSYVDRVAGREPVSYVHPAMESYLKDTMGVFIFQEQIMTICFEIGGFDWVTVADIRKAMSGSKGAEYFNRHGETFTTNAVANHGMEHATAKALWESMVAFGSWGFNASHSVAYGIISYWCAYLKAYHPLKYAAALLRNAKDDGQTLETLRELEKEGIEVISFDKDLSQDNWIAVDDKLIGGFQNINGIGPAKAADLLDLRELNYEAYEKKLEKALAKGTKFTDLREAHTKWGEIYDDPDSHNIAGKVWEFGELEDKQTAVVICQIKEVDRRDENEAIRIQRRGGKVWEGNSLFLDISVVDDSVSKPVIARIRPELWTTVAEKIADNAVVDKDWLLLRGRWLKEFNMMIVKKVKCLTNEEMLY